MNLPSMPNLYRCPLCGIWTSQDIDVAFGYCPLCKGPVTLITEDEWEMIKTENERRIENRWVPLSIWESLPESDANEQNA